MNRIAMLARASVVVPLLAASVATDATQTTQSGDDLAARIDAVMPRVIEWRHDIHQNPELSNREFRTAAKVAELLEQLGFDEVNTGVAHTGVVGRLVGGRPGPVVALRADMDALPVEEMTGLPFASTVRTEYNGLDVGVMHACGHDAHTAILMGAADVLAGMRDRIAGTVLFVFQPAEEGAPVGEDGGAGMMIQEGLLDGAEAPEAIFGLHVWPGPTGQLSYRSRGTMAAADSIRIRVEGRQTHGSMPWAGVDPIVAAAQIITALQLIPARQLDVTTAPAVVSIGSIHGGNRGNIIPDVVEMEGTVRTLDPDMREDFLERIRSTVEQVAATAGARATFTVRGYAPVTYNDPDLTARMVPTLRWAAGDRGLLERRVIMGAEDFSLFQERIPGFYFFLGVNREGLAEGEAAPNHSPLFFVNDDALAIGVRAMTGAALDYLGAR